MMKLHTTRIIFLMIIFIVSLLMSCTPKADTDIEPESATPIATEGESGDLFPLTILHSNDTHARILQFNSHGNTCDAEHIADGECFGGVARRATAINAIRDQKENVLLLEDLSLIS